MLLQGCTRVCEVLLPSFGRAKQGQSLVGAGGEMASGGPDVRGTEAMDQGDGEITQGGHNLWSIAGPQARAILPEGHIAHIMGTILNGIITNDKFCLSQMKQLPKGSARRGFPQALQYPSGVIEERGCPKDEIHEKTTVEHSTFHG
jgi:hypothetical protein